jgi:hypothetical protein
MKGRTISHRLRNLSLLAYELATKSTEELQPLAVFSCPLVLLFRLRESTVVGLHYDLFLFICLKTLS